MFTILDYGIAYT